MVTLRNFLTFRAINAYRGILYLCILHISHLSDIKFADIFSQLVVCYFNFLRVSFEAQTFLILINQIYNLLFYRLGFFYHTKCSLLNPRSLRFSPFFPML